mmetsp:Transcript_43060/g.138422  ORF Transcript_43060/g.138422 Transcript_43060/m.138422 type:complete len:103 (+) Transcript_43060:35-343(+)
MGVRDYQAHAQGDKYPALKVSPTPLEEQVRVLSTIANKASQIMLPRAPSARGPRWHPTGLRPRGSQRAPPSLSRQAPRPRQQAPSGGTTSRHHRPPKARRAA